MNTLHLIGRSQELFQTDLVKHETTLKDCIKGSSFLVIGGAGSIGQAVVKEIFKREPRRLHVIDISENNLVELVRDIRSSLGYIQGDFQTLPLDCASPEYSHYISAQKPYDYYLNLSALKHVRSEKDPYSLMRMIRVNILNTVALMKEAHQRGATKFFGVSTDKATNPVNMMGATKRVMELFMMRDSERINISTARFANVAFSDGSLLHGFNQRIQKQQPLSAPMDIRRYFVTAQESGILCLMSCILGDNRDIFFAKLDEQEHLISFADIAIRFLESLGYEAVPCNTEDEARARVPELIAQKRYPCFFSTSDTTGEKAYEEFYTDLDQLEMTRFHDIGVIKSQLDFESAKLDGFLHYVNDLLLQDTWTKSDLVDQIQSLLPNFKHKETNKYLDSRM